MFTKANRRVCVVAILKDEEAFIDEWLTYHRMIGVDHFFLYDDDPLSPLKSKFSALHGNYVTVIDWAANYRDTTCSNNQIRAYNHALENHIKDYHWVAFIDGDEFVVLTDWKDDLYRFLDDFEYAKAVLLNWHVFGHNGYYDDPKGLITASLTRRMALPSSNFKSFTKTKEIISIESAHFCHIVYGHRADANQRNFERKLYDGKSKAAHINHYQCRSFKRWMARAERGDVNFQPGNTPAEHQWRLNRDLCLKQFVTTVAKDKNELVDDYMKKFEPDLLKAMATLNQ